jgi:hypothetical protein
LCRLEDVSNVRRARTNNERGRDPKSPRHWLKLFESWGAQGFFDHEPDFPTALELYRQAVERGDPEPAEFNWLSEMLLRVSEGRPPVTQVEYRELAEWYERHERTVHDANIGFWLHRGNGKGARLIDATETTEKLRALRAAHPELL